MTRRSIALALAAALWLVPAAAFAQETDPEPPAAEEPTAVDVLGAFVDEVTALLSGEEADGDTATDGSGAGESDGESTSFVDAVRTVLGGVFDELYIDFVASRAGVDLSAESDVAALEEDPEGEGDEEASDDDGVHGEIVSTVAHCAPRGSIGALIEGATNHGRYVTAAAHGDTVELYVPTLTEGAEGEAPTVEPATDPTAFDLTTVEDADALCDALDVIYRARLLELELSWDDVEGARDARDLAKQTCQLERQRARSGDADAQDAKDACRDARDQAKEVHAQEREDRKAEKAAEREERKQERAAARAERGGSKGD